MVSQIGGPLERPHAIDVAIRIAEGSVEPKMEILAVIEDELARISSIAKELVERSLAIGRWPLRGSTI